MTSYNWIEKVAEKLHIINFNQIIKYNQENDVVANPYKYGFAREENRLKDIAGYCTKCGREEAYKSQDYDSKGFKLNNISHGTHTLDFLEAMGVKNVKELIEDGWRDDPVIFLMENPSVDYGIYHNLKDQEEGKRPAISWYWIHEKWSENYKIEDFSTDKFLVQQQYGKMVASLIYQFKLGNAYMTNLVKCGISDARLVEKSLVETGYKNLDDYSGTCITTCVTNVFKDEVKALSAKENKYVPLRIFAFGNRTYSIVADFLRHCTDLDIEYQLYKLPHPANRESNSYRKYILRGIIGDSLKDNSFFKTGTVNTIISESEVRETIKEQYKGEYVFNDKKLTSKKPVLKIEKRKSLFTGEEIVTEVWIKGKKDRNASFTWGIGYNFESKEYWYWNYDEGEYLSESEISHSVRFKKAIETVIQKENL